jgi:two-component system LytT family response regulator
MYRTVIIGRTEREISNLSNQIKEYLADKLELIGTSRTIKKGILLIKKEVPDLVILEIYKRKPFKFLEKFKTPYPFEFIITSSDKNYALEAFRLGAFDYMVHPISTGELTGSINRLEKKWKESPNANQAARRELFIPMHNGFVMENRDNIMYFEGAIVLAP